MSKFENGDKARIVCNLGTNFEGVSIGDIGTVVNVYDCGMEEYPIALNIKNHNEYCFKENELELITDKELAEIEKLGKCVPVGIEPKDIWLKKRKRDILDAIERYAKAEITIPIEWVVELRELEEIGN